MKLIIRYLVFIYISLFVSQTIIGGFYFTENKNFTLLLVIMALLVMNLFLSPLLRLTHLPHSGIGYLFIGILVNTLLFYSLALVIPSFNVDSATISELIIFGIVLPSKSLTKSWALIYASTLYVIVFNFFMWLSSNKK